MWTEWRLDGNEPFFIFSHDALRTVSNTAWAKRLSFSPKPERWSCEISQGMSDFDTCQFILIRIVYTTDRLVSIFVQDLMWHMTSAYMYWVYGRSAFVRYVITKLFTKFSYPSCSTARASRARAPLLKSYLQISFRSLKKEIDGCIN